MTSFRIGHHDRPERRGGLTLVEMLVVVAALTVLLAVLLPAVDRSRAYARQAQCIDNLHAIGTGLAAYQTGQRMMPAARSLAAPVVWPDDRPPLTLALGSYVRSSRTIYHCPSDERMLYHACGISYFYNAAVGGRTLEAAVRDDAQGRSAAQLPLSGDADAAIFYTTRGRPLQVDLFHDQRNVLFADMHVDQADRGTGPTF